MNSPKNILDKLVTQEEHKPALNSFKMAALSPRNTVSPRNLHEMKSSTPHSLKHHSSLSM
jgi:hypothetical protein